MFLVWTFNVGQRAETGKGGRETETNGSHHELEHNWRDEFHCLHERERARNPCPSPGWRSH